MMRRSARRRNDDLKKLTRLLLIHWYTYDRELIEFENINFDRENSGGKVYDH